jgi:hypothetical protein
LAYNLRSDGGKVFENKFLVEAGKPIKQIGGMECVTTKNGNTTCTDKDKTTKYEFGKVELCNDKGAGCRDFRSGETSAPCKPSDKSKDACRPMSLRTKTGAGTGEGEEEGKKKETVTGEGEGGGTKKEKEKREEIEKNIKERCGTDNECPNDVKNLLKELKNTDMTKSIDEDKFLNRANSIIVEHNIINKQCGTYSADCKNDAEMNKLLKKVRNIKKPVKEEDALNEAISIIEKIKKEKEKRKKIKDDIYEERCGIYYINECKADAEMNKLLTKVADIKKPVKEEDALNEAISIIEKITREKEKRIKIEDDIYKQCGIYIDECKDDGDMNGLLKEVADIKISVKRGKILEKAAPIIAKVKEQTDEKEVKRMTDSLKSAVAKAVNKMTEVTSRFTYYKSDSNLPDGVAQVVKNVMAMVKEAVKEVRSTRVKAVEEEARAKNMSLTSSNITNILNVNEWKKTPLAQQLLQLAKEVVSVAEEVELAEARKEAEDWIKLKEPAMMNKLQEAEELVMLIKTEAMVEALRLRGTKRADTPAKMDKEQMAVWALVEVSVEEMLKKERVKGISSKKERDATEDLKRDALAMWEVRKMMMRITWGAKE